MERIPFRKEELEIKAPPLVKGRLGVPILNTPITPRENFLAFLGGEEPLWMPFFTDTLSITPAVVPDNISRGFVFDASDFDPNRSAGGPDMFGVEWEWVPSVGGSMVRPGSPKVPDITEWESYITFPDIDSWDWAGSAEINRKLIDQKEFLLGTTILNGLFERLISFCDMDEALIAMIDEDEQEAVHRLFSRLADLYPRLIRKFKDYFGIEIVTFHDDWGSQRAPLLSLDTVEEMIVPYLKRIVDSTHEMGIYFELHSCGKNEMLVPAMIDAGVDLWNGQPMNDKEMLAKKYGDRIIIGADPPAMAPDTPKEEIERNCREFIETFNPYRSYGGRVRGLPGARELLYEYSRAAKCGRA